MKEGISNFFCSRSFLCRYIYYKALCVQTFYHFGMISLGRDHEKSSASQVAHNDGFKSDQITLSQPIRSVH